MIRSLLHIPCRISSSRLAAKNIIPIADKPSFYWPTVAAIESGEFDKIVISTDSPSTIHLFKHDYPELDAAEIIKQIPSTVLQTTKDVVAEYECESAQVSIAQATAVLLPASDIKAVVTASKIAAVPYMIVNRTHDPSWTLTLLPDGTLKRSKAWWNPKAPWYADSGEFYTFPPYELMRCRELLEAKGIRGYVVPRSRTVDIDYEDDVAIAVALFDYHRAPGIKPFSGSPLPDVTS